MYMSEFIVWYTPRLSLKLRDHLFVAYTLRKRLRRSKTHYLIIYTTQFKVTLFTISNFVHVLRGQ